MIHIPDHLISFYNISGRGDASITTTENTELQGLLRSLQLEQENNSFIQARNRGGLVNPSDDLIGILKEAEINFRREVNKSK
jgi:hypothetical protein